MARARHAPSDQGIMAFSSSPAEPRGAAVALSILKSARGRSLRQQDLSIPPASDINKQSVSFMTVAGERAAGQSPSLECILP